MKCANCSPLPGLVLAVVVLLVAALVGLCGCEAPSPEPSAFVLAVVAAWVAEGLPTPGPGCQLEWFRVWAAPDVEAYREVCPPDSWACYSRPVAVLHPDAGWRADRLAAHELLHELTYCVLGDMDYEHTNARVWVGVEDQTLSPSLASSSAQ